MKTVYTKLVALLLTSCFSHLAQGQENYLPGTIVTPKGDTIAGFIDYRKWYQNPKKVSFKKEIAGSSTVYTTSDIAAFKVSGELYESGIVTIETSPYKLQELNDSSIPQYKADTTFLLNIVSGNKSLYHYKVGSDRDFFYIKSGPSFELLVYKQYKTIDERNNIPDISRPLVVKENNFFLNQLSLYLKDCSEITKTLKNTKYKQSDLIKAFRVYSACTNESIKTASSDRPRNQLGIFVGPSAGTMHFKGMTLNGASDLALNKSIVGGAYWNIALPRSLSNFSSYNELMFTSFSIKGENEVFTSADNYEKTVFEFNYAYLKINTMLRYTRQLGSGYGFVGAGISNGYAIKENNEATTTKKFYSTTETFKKPLFPTSKYEQGFLLGVGAGVKKISGEIRYERSNGSLNAVMYSNNIERYSLLLGYRLGK
ncbi:hypothetical protein LRS06_10295 [Hymenobacter sp. J193]|uniref:hypothetical protein n=1 Tax=Hymenobacter sp. J193 TaxID=2898429 RepID=UPI002150974D|nr:hypothetical protein [Hymenobacter sp. J193]MCR5888153.1 hypothetical protein [Hymenobacter sp. J193]